MIAIIHALAYTEAAANTMKIFLGVIKYWWAYRSLLLLKVKDDVSVI